MKSFIIKTVSSLLFFTFWGCGNSALYWIQEGDKIIVPESKKTVSQKLQIENIISPYQSKPIFSFQVSQTDKVNYSYYYKLQEVEKEWHYGAFSRFSVWTFGWIVLAPIWWYFVENDIKKEGELEISKAPRTLNGELNYHDSDISRPYISWYPTGELKDSEIKTESVENKLSLKIQR